MTIFVVMIRGFSEERTFFPYSFHVREEDAEISAWKGCKEYATTDYYIDERELQT